MPSPEARRAASSPERARRPATRMEARRVLSGAVRSRVAGMVRRKKVMMSRVATWWSMRESIRSTAVTMMKRLMKAVVAKSQVRANCAKMYRFSLFMVRGWFGCQEAVILSSRRVRRG